MKKGYIKKEDRKKILLLTDDTNEEMGINDSSVVLYPCDGYGDERLVRMVIEREKPDAILLITDPRYFEWLFNMEDEIRSKIPITYLNIWDDLPAPMYNQEFYDSCDALFGISKQTKNINEMVLGEKTKTKVIKYIPHGLNHKKFYPLDKKNEELIKFSKNIRNEKEIDFTLFFNSRNIRRKCIPDTILAWKLFLDTLSKSQRDKCQFVLHTNPIDNNGTDLPTVIRFLFPEEDHNIVMSTNPVSTEQMNILYNNADGVILLSSAEGWGLSLTEALLTGTPIIANVTGGMQDQMRFTDENGKWYTPNPDVPSNHRKTYTECGEWALPVYPTNRSLVGSPKTPYIYDDRCSPEDAALQIGALYRMGDKERKRIGNLGKEWALGDEAGFTSEKMANRIIEGFEETFKNFKPKSKFSFTSDSEISKKVLNHKLIY